ncbi:hypothetical protein Tco_0212830 [Tanacetum coccineum]
MGPLTSSTPTTIPQSAMSYVGNHEPKIGKLVGVVPKASFLQPTTAQDIVQLKDHATVHDGHIVTETVQGRASGNVGNTSNRRTQNYGQMTDNVGKKVICYNCRGEGRVSRQRYTRRTPKLHVEWILMTIHSEIISNPTYSEFKMFPTEVSLRPPGEISMITILDDLRTQLDGHLKVNQEQSLVNDSLRAELARCKQEKVS